LITSSKIPKINGSCIKTICVLNSKRILINSTSQIVFLEIQKTDNCQEEKAEISNCWTLPFWQICSILSFSTEKKSTKAMIVASQNLWKTDNRVSISLWILDLEHDELLPFWTLPEDYHCIQYRGFLQQVIVGKKLILFISGFIFSFSLQD
jgi:hypothetical protein